MGYLHRNTVVLSLPGLHRCCLDGADHYCTEVFSYNPQNKRHNLLLGCGLYSRAAFTGKNLASFN